MSGVCFFIGTTLADNPVPHHFEALSRELVRRGHRVVLITPHRKTELVDAISNPAVYTWPSERPTHLRDALFLRQLIREYGPSCFIANFAAVSLMTTMGWWLGIRRRVTWYHTLSDQIRIDSDRPRWLEAPLRLRRRLVYRLATEIVPVSGAARRDVMRTYGVPAAKCTVFLNDLADPLNGGKSVLRAARGSRALCVARLFRSKGQDVLIRALALLKKSGSPLHVDFVGEGPERSSLERLAQDLGVGDQCHFHGRTGHGEVLTKMSEATVTVLPSRSDNCPLVTIESLAVGTPLVVSRVGGLPEIVRDGGSGFLVAPDDPQALADRLSLVVSDDALWTRLSREARRDFLKRFELTHAVTAQADWLESLVVAGGA
ncbi:MAG: glycosyltransferase family 4 protein [Thermoanaerobaculia bacterium]